MTYEAKLTGDKGHYQVYSLTVPVVGTIQSIHQVLKFRQPLSQGCYACEPRAIHII